jgi:hypothetical protein
MKAGDAIHVVNALRECAESLEIEVRLAIPHELDEPRDFALSDTLRGALVELACTLGTELGLELVERVD